MNKLHFLFFVGSVIFCHSCKVNELRGIQFTDFEFARINEGDSISYSKYEVTNRQYRTFLQNQKHLSRKEYNVIEVDTNAWNTENKYYHNDPMARNYFQQIAYDHYPVVNISFEAAKKYCTWLSSISIDTTISYRLPTQEEFFDLVETVDIKYDSDNADDYEEFNFNLKFKGNYPGDGAFFSYTSNTRKNTSWPDYKLLPYEQNKLGCRNIIGNVHELLLDGSYTGGSWNSLPSEVLEVKKYDRPMPTIGFRIVKVKRKS